MLDPQGRLGRFSISRQTDSGEVALSVVLVAVYILSNYMTKDIVQARAAFALANLHYAIHVFWDVHDVSVFSPTSMRKHARETWVGVGLLVIGIAVPLIMPDVFSAKMPSAVQWGLIIALPLIGANLMRNFIYGSFMRTMVRALRA